MMETRLTKPTSSYFKLRLFILRFSLSSSEPKARAGSRTAKPYTLNTIAAVTVSEDDLPFAEPKSPRAGRLRY